MNKHFAFRFLTIFSVFACFSVVFAQEMRIWTDSTGKFTIEASLVSFEDDTVKLQNKDGKVLTLAIDKLSEADKMYLSESDSSANPFEAAERAASRNTSAPSVSVKTVDINNAKEVGDYGETSWSCPPDPDPLKEMAAKKITFRSGAVPFHSHAKDNGFFFSRDGKKVLYALQVPKPSIGNETGEDSTRICLADVASGEVNVMKNSLCLNPYGISPDGTKAMFVQVPWEFGINSGKKGKILIFNCSSKQLEPFAILNPIDLQRQSRNQETADVEQAAWVANDLILVLYASGTERLLALVNIETGKAIWRLKPDFPEKSFTLSPGGKFFLVKSGNTMLLIDTVSGKTVGTLEGTNERNSASYSFSPDGRKIAACADGMIRLWNATTGQQGEAFFIDGASGHSNFSWVSGRHLLIGNKLIDAALQVPIWEYQGSINNGCFFGGQFWYMSGNNDAKTLVGVTIPQKKVLDLFSGNQNDDNLFAVRPGMTVGLKLDSSISRDKDEIGRSMEDKLRNNGLTLANNAPVTFLLKVTSEGEKTVTYTTERWPMMMNRGGGTEVKFRQDKYEILLQQGNNTLWSRSFVTGAPDVSLDEVANSSLQAVVQKKVHERHYKDWFLGLNIPKQIPRTDNIGKSTLNELGLRDN